MPSDFESAIFSFLSAMVMRNILFTESLGCAKLSCHPSCKHLCTAIHEPRSEAIHKTYLAHVKHDIHKIFIGQF